MNRFSYALVFEINEKIRLCIPTKICLVLSLKSSTIGDSLN